MRNNMSFEEAIAMCKSPHISKGYTIQTKGHEPIPLCDDKEVLHLKALIEEYQAAVKRLTEENKRLREVNEEMQDKAEYLFLLEEERKESIDRAEEEIKRISNQRDNLLCDIDELKCIIRLLSKQML